MTAAAQRSAALACLFVFAGVAADAETIYRCGDSYSQTPCPNGKTIEIDAPVSAARRAAALEVAASEKRLANEMVRDRHERERAIRPASAVSLGAPPAGSTASAPAKKHARARKKHGVGADPGSDFVAVVPKTKG